MSEAFVANYKVRLTMSFAISISVRSTTTLSDAYTARDVIIDDGKGNGVQPLFRSAMYGLYQNLAEKSEIKDTILMSNVDNDKSSAPTAYFADAIVMIEVSQTISV